jgi:transcriptional regulator with XRE-family HTH domain
MNELARRLKQDIDSGLSRYEIADKARVSEATVRNALQGRGLSHATLESFAKHYFKMPIDEVYRMADLIPPRDLDETLPYEEERIVKRIRSMRDKPYYEQALRTVEMVLDTISFGTEETA